MAMILEPPNGSPVDEAAAAGPSVNLSSVLPAACQPDQDQPRPEQRSTATTLVLSQGWSFAGLAAGLDSPEPAGSEVAPGLSQPATDTTTATAFQESISQLSDSDTAATQATKPADQASPLAGLLSHLIRWPGLALTDHLYPSQWKHAP